MLSEIMKSWSPPPLLKVSTWADKYRMLSPEASAEPGKWNTERAAYQKGIMDAVNDPDIETIVFMKSAQVGATEILNNICGYFIDVDPAPILVVQPTMEMRDTWSKDRFSPMIRDSERIRHKIKDPKSRDSNNTIKHKVFTGGHLTIAISNSPASLSSRPIRIVLLDEIDRYPASAGAEGDPVGLAIKRSETFWNRFKLYTSTPTVKNLSRIESAWNETDQKKYFVKCWKCKTYQVMIWGQVKWDKNENGNHLPDTAYYECEKCQARWNDVQKLEAVRKGEWRATAVAKRKDMTGFHIWEAYSPWSTFSKMVTDFLEKKDNPEQLKTFVNLTLGELWEEEGEKVESNILYSRREKYTAQIPAGGLVLTAGVDVQDDRVEIEVKAWGKGEESWSVDYVILHGDLSSEKFWKDLDQKLQTNYQHEDGINLAISCTCVDSGGHFTEQVYKFCKGKELSRIYAIKGSNVVGRPLVSRPSKSNKGNVKLFSIGTDTAKQIIYSRLKMDETGSGYMHFPLKYDEEYFNQLTAERATTRYTRGFPHRVWVKDRARNEVLDATVYCMAALAILNPNFEKIAQSFKKIKNEIGNVEKETHVERKQRKKGWVNNWKK